MKNFKFSLLILFFTIFIFSCNTEEQFEIAEPASIDSKKLNRVIDFDEEYYLNDDELARLIENPSSAEFLDKFNLEGQESGNQTMQIKLVPYSEVDLRNNCGAVSAVSAVARSRRDHCCSTDVVNCPVAPRFVFPTACWGWIFESFDVRHRWSWSWEGESSGVGASRPIPGTRGCTFSPVIENPGPNTFLIFRSLANTSECPRTLVYTSYIQYKMYFGDTARTFRCGEFTYSVKVPGTDPTCMDQ